MSFGTFLLVLLAGSGIYWAVSGLVGYWYKRGILRRFSRALRRWDTKRRVK